METKFNILYDVKNGLRKEKVAEQNWSQASTLAGTAILKKGVEISDAFMALDR